MECGASWNGDHDAAVRRHTPLWNREGMSYWRWLLFAVMSRAEVREDVYLGIPNATIIPREVSVEPGGDMVGSRLRRIR